MRASRVLRATATSAGAGSGLKPPPMAILPPLPLYRRILRAHRKHLPVELRILGDKYVKKEFRDHKSVENPLHIVSFQRSLSHQRVTYCIGT
jgi:Complex1_LYR-like